MGVNSLPKTVTRQRRGCDLNPGPSAPQTSTLTTRLQEGSSDTSSGHQYCRHLLQWTVDNDSRCDFLR